MSENKKKSGVRTDLSPSEFANGWNTGKSKSFKSGFKKFNYILSALGIMPMLTNDSGINGHRSHRHVNNTPHSSNSLKQNYRVEQTPKARTHEQWLIDEMAHKAYHDLVDGKGDHDCGHEH